MKTIDVTRVAKLANLPLKPGESNLLETQLSETVSFVDELKEVETKHVPPTSQVTGKTNQFREDEVKPSLTQEEALKNAPKTKNGFFVSKIVWD